jgi:hypothetical protein
MKELIESSPFARYESVNGLFKSLRQTDYNFTPRYFRYNDLLNPLLRTVIVLLYFFEPNLSIPIRTIDASSPEAGSMYRGSLFLVSKFSNSLYQLLPQALGNQPVQLKMKVENGYQIQFFWSEDEKNWREVTNNAAHYNGNFLPPWDRSPRPGMLHQGAINEAAVFNFFEITYR